jgi:Oxidoreductase family, NAD-binding Rossmann fold
MRWQDMVGEPLDAVMVLPLGDHAPAALAAARAGMHVFVEKPMALSAARAEEMIGAAHRAGVVLMVGTMKRYDPDSGSHRAHQCCCCEGALTARRGGCVMSGPAREGGAGIGMMGKAAAGVEVV